MNAVARSREQITPTAEFPNRDSPVLSGTGSIGSLPPRFFTGFVSPTAHARML